MRGVILLVVLIIASPVSAAFASECTDRCSTQLSMRLAQCQQEQFTYLQHNMNVVCTDGAHRDYEACLNHCPGNTIGPRRLPPSRVQPLPPYSPDSMQWRSWR